MTYRIEISQGSERPREESVDAPTRVDETGVELKRGAFLNTIAMLASNFRGIFSFLVARLLGPAALGIFSVAWSTTDIISKIGVLGLDNAITTFVARSEAVGNRARSRTLFRIAVVLGVAQSILTASIVIVALRFFNNRLRNLATWLGRYSSAPSRSGSVCGWDLSAAARWRWTVWSWLISRRLRRAQKIEVADL
jgi:O-antigen/teichoic acid export membrane protein